MSSKGLYRDLESAFRHSPATPALEERVHTFYELCCLREFPCQRLRYEADDTGIALVWPKEGLHCWIDPRSYAIENSYGFFFDSHDAHETLAHLQVFLLKKQKV